MKGIVLAGGKGTRLYPSTAVVCKQLIPIYNKPMIYYPISTLMLAGIRDILIISTPQDTAIFQKILGTGCQLGLTFSYAVQQEPNGIAEVFIVGEQFIQKNPVALILGDNIFFGHGFTQMVQEARASVESEGGALSFGYYVSDPEHYGVFTFDDNGAVVSIEEKPREPKSNIAQTGLYFYDNRVVEIARSLVPSARGELEITDVNMTYLREGTLRIKLLGRGFAWLDTGTPEAMLEASQFIGIIERRQNLKVAFLEEIAFRMGYINREQLLTLAEANRTSEYGEYLVKLAARKDTLYSL
ncbi:MAG: glucose-1-phosphate thymidylyltransferase RfbA [Vulcanimicrobiota bacterium]